MKKRFKNGNWKLNNYEKVWSTWQCQYNLKLKNAQVVNTINVINKFVRYLKKTVFFVFIEKVVAEVVLVLRVIKLAVHQLCTEWALDYDQVQSLNDLTSSKAFI
jgi:hypothetical protein